MLAGNINEHETRVLLSELAGSLFARGFSVGSAGNISVRLPDGYLMTPTNSSLRNSTLSACRSWIWAFNMSAVTSHPRKCSCIARSISRAMMPEPWSTCIRRRPRQCHACRMWTNRYPIPPLTPYFVMRVGRRMPIIPYYRPGDPAMEPAIFKAAKDARAVLLANHGPVIAGRTLTDAVYAAEELEEAAKLFLILRGQSPRLLSAPQVDDLLAAFG